MGRGVFRTIVAGVSAFVLTSGALAASPSITDYQAWLAQGRNAERVSLFEAELDARGLFGLVPTHQILRTALSWKECGAEPYELPDPATWEGAFGSLRVLRDEIIPAVGDVEIVSGYRHQHLNTCAGGASKSVHRQFGAFDGYVTGISRGQMVAKLCDWHSRRGAALEAGLGIYRGTKFHIDVGIRGNRRWGSNYRANSSPCNAGVGAVVAAQK
ncbi:MAG: D-Ala-D-Ala carboxypeptidase family metallohydrolase [Pacificimonas sp.]|jgi:hypothetical protein|nr:D-Ala-D-Ala carboxypeptidase family metallohydrolase [Pacificimonas sp.]